jgi:AcrR family transcriptional regulator
MPTKTFFNLPEEKRQKLLEAIHGEFSRVQFSDVSINQIIKMADIPRGSFYQYFKDKNDVLQYLTADYRKMMKDKALSSLKHNGGDLFQMYLDIFDFSYAFITEEKNNMFFRNIFADININTDFLRQQTYDSAIDESTNAMLPYINMDLLDICSKDDLNNMLGIVLILTGEAFAKAFFDISSFESSRAQYAARLELLKRGFLKAKREDK